MGWDVCYSMHPRSSRNEMNGSVPTSDSLTVSGTEAGSGWLRGMQGSDRDRRIHF